MMEVGWEVGGMALFKLEDRWVGFLRGGSGSGGWERGRRTLVVLGWVKIIHTKWLVFGNDFFQFSLDS